MEKTIAAALVAVVCIGPVRHNGEKYAPGATIEGMKPAQAQQLIDAGQAELVDEVAADGEDGGQAAADALAVSKPAAKPAAAKK